MRLCDLDEIKIQVKRQYEDCHGYSGNKKTIYREAILAVRSILHSAKAIDAVPVVRCAKCVHYEMGVCLKIYDDGAASSYAWQKRKPDDFCSYAERKEGADNEP